MTRWFRSFPLAAGAAAVALAAGPAAAQGPPATLPPVEVISQDPGQAGQGQPGQSPEDQRLPSGDAGGPAAAQPGGSQSQPAGGGCGTTPDGRFDFKKVPPVQVFPRPGFFSIPPSGPGYYSLLDRLTGNYRQEAPKFGYPPFALMGPGLFDADWRYLDDPKTPPQDFLDRLKRIHIGDDWLFSTGGQASSRYMNEWNSRLTEQNNVYDLYRVRTYGDLWYKDVFRFYVEGIYADSAWQDLPPQVIDRNKGDFQNLFVDLKVMELGGQPVYVRTGRQELLLGSQRLVSTLDWANTRRTFEGVRAFRQSEKFDVDLFWLRPVIPNADRLDSWDDKQNFAGAWATYRPKKGTFLDFYYLFLSNKNQTTQLGVVRSPFDRHTFGSRYAGDVDNTYLWDVEGAMQLGTQTGQNVVAGMFTAGLGYHAKTAWDPTLWVYYDYASGDANPTASGGTYTTFNQLFPFGHYYFGWIDVVGRQNIHDLNTILYLYPAKWLTTWLQFHWFALDQAKDALYNSAGVAIRRDPTGRAGNDVGRELDLIFNFHLTKRADLLTGYSYLWGGSFLKNTSGPNAAVDTSLYYLMYNYRW